jgi:hypothetical protein
VAAVPGNREITEYLTTVNYSQYGWILTAQSVELAEDSSRTPLHQLACYPNRNWSDLSYRIVLERLKNNFCIAGYYGKYANNHRHKHMGMGMLSCSMCQIKILQ